MGSLNQLDMGMRMPTEDWLNLNGRLVFERPELFEHVAPFPPPHLMQNVSGLTSQADFASHGVTIYRAVHDASPKPLVEYRSILDFGCGCGRLARLFKGHPGKFTGCDLDARHVDWINAHLQHMVAVQTQPNAALPFSDAAFDAIIGVSVFSHLDEKSQKLYLAELARVSTNNAYLFLTIHGERAMERATKEDRIYKMLEVPEIDLQNAAMGMREGKHNFIIQKNGHLTSETYRYGITFISSNYINRVWGEFFDVVDIVSGAIHDFQDIVVCRKR
jgi:SAM-dependent methyltransferase